MSARMMGFRHGQHKVYAHSWQPFPSEPPGVGITDWKFSVDEDGRISADLSFESEDAMNAALERFRAAGYEIVKEQGG